MSRHVLIKGIPVPPGQAPGLRKEFSTWATTDPKTSIQVSLFIRALQKFYDVKYDNTLSYFQVAGASKQSPPPPHITLSSPSYSPRCRHSRLSGDRLGWFYKAQDPR